MGHERRNREAHQWHELLRYQRNLRGWLQERRGPRRDWAAIDHHGRTAQHVDRRLQVLVATPCDLADSSRNAARQLGAKKLFETLRLMLATDACSSAPLPVHNADERQHACPRRGRRIGQHRLDDDVGRGLRRLYWHRFKQQRRLRVCSGTNHILGRRGNVHRHWRDVELVQRPRHTTRSKVRLAWTWHKPLRHHPWWRHLARRRKHRRGRASSKGRPSIFWRLVPNDSKRAAYVVEGRSPRFVKVDARDRQLSDVEGDLAWPTRHAIERARDPLQHAWRRGHSRVLNGVHDPLPDPCRGGHIQQQLQ
mmetsp:Transcript_72530/g.201135  ORF Transcript_72530/g.201135 Transcript_72530/m.201135 type:complete len:308 (-) Transcript_72530:861-1784(-)